MSSLEGNPPVWAYIKAAWDATASQRLRCIAFIVLFILAYSIELLVPWAQGYAIDAFVRFGVNDIGMWHATMGILAFLAFRLTYAVFQHLGRYIQMTVAYNARMETLEKIFAAIFRFPLHWHTKNHSGDSLSKLNRSVGAIDNAVGTYVWLVIEGLVKVFMATGALFALDALVAFNVLFMGLLTVLFMVLFNKRLTARYRQNNIFNNKITRICIDYLFNVVTIKTLNLEGAAEKYLDVQREEGAGYCRKITKYNELKWGTTAMGYTLMMGSSLFLYFWKIRSTGAVFEVQAVYVMISYVDKIFQAITSFTGYYGGIIESSTAYEDGAKILREAKVLPEALEEGLLESGWQQLNFHDLKFSYIAGESRGLREMSFSIGPKEKIAIVGGSGGGKSTLLKVIGGMLLAESGYATTDRGETLALNTIYPISLLIPQEPEIFSETLRYNVTMGDTFPEGQIKKFIDLARLQGVIDKLPDGLDTDLAEKGLNLSVGEKQRVAMVRGLMRAENRQIILLDEPTSSLDPKTEKEVFLSLLDHFSDRVIMTACHRLNIVPLFDRILFVRDGQIIESGSFSELLRKGGAFAEAWEDYEKKVPKQNA
jgi:ATP-binding cassette, subfamily B, bacterial